MTDPDIFVEKVEPDGLVVGTNNAGDIPVGTTFTQLVKSHVAPSSGGSTELSSTSIGLRLTEAVIFGKAVETVPRGFSAGLRLEGIGMQEVVDALADRTPAHFVHLRAYSDKTAMEKVKAEALKSSFAFLSGTEIHRIERTPHALKIYVGGGRGEPGCLVTFENSLGFRVVDERDLMEYWPVCSTPSGWLFHILSGGWLDQERKRPGSLMLETDSDVKEYLVTGAEDCVSVFSFDDPTLTEYEFGSDGL